MAGLSDPTYVPLEPPDPPTPPDFHLCHPFYGSNLNENDCVQAAGLLPVGNRPLLLDSPSESFRFPMVSSHRDCVVTVRWAYPHHIYPLGSTSISPNAFRIMASWLLFICVGSSGLGGFGTIGIQNMIDWTANPATTDSSVVTGLWPADATYFTVTVTGNTSSKTFDPGFNDPILAEALSDGVLAKGDRNRAGIFSLTGRIMKRVVSAAPARSWWSLLGTWNRGGNYDIPASRMVYDCDIKLGSPSPTDCAQLAYSGLGPPSDIITVGPGSAAKFLSYKTCHAVISALTSIALTWAQISAGLNTLIDTCVEHPLPQGGTAFLSVASSTTSGRKRVAPDITGFDALPPSVNISLSSGTLHS